MIYLLTLSVAMLLTFFIYACCKVSSMCSRYEEMEYVKYEYK